MEGSARPRFGPGTSLGWPFFFHFRKRTTSRVDDLILGPSIGGERAWKRAEIRLGCPGQGGVSGAMHYDAYGWKREASERRTEGE